MSRYRVLAIFLALLSMQGVSRAASLEAASTLTGKIIVGYQGWFGCPHDSPGNRDWVHWFFNNTADAAHLSVDLLPATHEFDKRDLCSTKMTQEDGTPIQLFSAQNPNIVRRHFQWMAQNHIDGVALQRLTWSISDPVQRSRKDRVLENVMAAAKAQGRVFFITYDITGAKPDKVVEDVEKDWEHLVHDLRVTASPNYLRDNGKPVLELWGFGFTDRPGSPSQVAELIKWLKAPPYNMPPATIVGGVPTDWRTLDGDSKTDEGWANVYRMYDILSPWSVARFSDGAGVDRFITSRVLPDLIETKRLGIGYLPVIFPGFSWYNLMTGRGYSKNARHNQIPRRCGRFYWRQIHELLSARVRMLYAAMFDEVDEGTALFKVKTRKNQLPRGAPLVFLDEDGCELPSDWYLRITGKAGDYLKASSLPPADLDAVLTR